MKKVIMFYETGEVRLPKKDEWYLSMDGDPLKATRDHLPVSFITKGAAIRAEKKILRMQVEEIEEEATEGHLCPGDSCMPPISGTDRITEN